MVKMAIQKRRFPKSLKTSKIIPLFKGGTLNPSEPKSFRPVNILCSLSKILEKVIFTQIQAHFDNKGVIPSNHHGSRRNHSTTTAIIELYENMLDAYENGEISSMIALDQSQAYDLIDHQIILQRLKIVGADKPTCDLMASYFEGRDQYVYIETKSSDRLVNEPCSVIQGSIGSCLMYALATADLPASIHRGHAHTSKQEADCPSGRITTFVDDSTNIIKARDVPNLQHHSQQTVLITKDYLTSNKMVINMPKTQFMVTGQPRGRNEVVTINIEGTEIQSQHTMKILGVVLSDDRTWSRHVSYLIKSVQPQIMAIRRMARVGSVKTVAMVARATIISKLTYAIQVWGGTTVENRRRIQVVINQTARMILRPTSYRLPTPQLMKLLNWQSIDQLVQIHTLNLATNVAHTSQPAEIHTRLSRFRQQITRNGDETTRILPSWRKVKSLWSFLPRAIQLLNGCPVTIKNTQSKIKRKKQIKSYIMENGSYYVTPIGTQLRGGNTLMGVGSYQTG